MRAGPSNVSGGGSDLGSESEKADEEEAELDMDAEGERGGVPLGPSKSTGLGIISRGDGRCECAWGGRGEGGERGGRRSRVGEVPRRAGASKMSKICSSGAGLASSAEAVASWRRGEGVCVEELLAVEDERREAARPSAVRARRMGVVGRMVVCRFCGEDARRSSRLMYVWL